MGMRTRWIGLAGAAAGAVTALVLAVPFGLASTASAGGGGCHSPDITSGAGATVDIEHFCYGPTVLHVEAGETVRWVNHDAVPHTVTGVNYAWGNYEQFGLDEEMAFTFDEPGVFPYWCILHPGMIGVVVVGDGAPPAPGETSTAAGTREVPRYGARGRRPDDRRERPRRRSR